MRNVGIARVNGRRVVNPRINHDVGLVVTGTCEQVACFFTAIVGETKVRVPVAAVDLQTTEAVDQEYVDHASHSFGAVNRRGAVLQDVDVVDQTKREPVEINRRRSGSGKSSSVLQNQGFFWIDTAQTDTGGAVTTVGVVLSNVRSSRCRNSQHQVGRSAHTQSSDVVPAIGIDRVWADFFRSGNVRTRHDNAFGRGFSCGWSAGRRCDVCSSRRWRRRLLSARAHRDD